jgi:hypothetical protein
MTKHRECKKLFQLLVIFPMESSDYKLSNSTSQGTNRRTCPRRHYWCVKPTLRKNQIIQESCLNKALAQDTFSKRELGNEERERAITLSDITGI